MKSIITVTVMICYSSTRQSYIVTISKPYSTRHRVAAYSLRPYNVVVNKNLNFYCVFNNKEIRDKIL